MPTPGTGKRKGAKKPAAPWDCLPADVLQAIACGLPERDRYNLNLVCRSWREGLADGTAVWGAVTVDPRKKASTSRRIRFNKHLPTAEALDAWFWRYGRHVTSLHLRHLDAEAQAEGCIAAADVAGLLRAVAGGLRQLCFQQCSVKALLSCHSADLRCLHQLTSLHFLMRRDECLGLDSPEAAFITTLTRLQDLALATGQGGSCSLPASLAALPSLRSLQLLRLLGDGANGGADGGGGGHIGLHLTPDEMVAGALMAASCLTGLTALQRLAVSNFLLLQERGGQDGNQDGGGNAAAEEGPLMRVPSALFGLPSLTSLTFSNIGLGLGAPGGNLHHGQLGLYAVPAELALLAGTLRELGLLQHNCAPRELDVLSALTGLTKLALTTRFRGLPSAVPAALSQLTALAHLKMSHGLTQVPPAITGLTQLTLLDLSHNSLHSLKPGPYLKRLVAVSLGANAFTHFPQQLKVARHTAQEIHLFSNEAMTISDKDLEQLLTFEQLRQLTIYGASEDKTTRRCLAALQKGMPWLMIDV